MKKKQTKQEYSTVRESISIEDQVQEQLRAYRQARNAGYLEGMENTISGLFDVLSPWIPKDDKDAYLDTKYAPVTIIDLYTTADSEEIKKYGELDDDRLNEIKSNLIQLNRSNFYKACDKRIMLIMGTFKKLGLGFQEEVTAEIHFDKKKVTGQA